MVNNDGDNFHNYLQKKNFPLKNDFIEDILFVKEFICAYNSLGEGARKGAFSAPGENRKGKGEMLMKPFFMNLDFKSGDLKPNDRTNIRRLSNMKGMFLDKELEKVKVEVRNREFINRV